MPEKKVATVLGAVAATISAIALYTFIPKMVGAKNDDADTVDSELSATPPELTAEEKKAVEEARVAAHKRLKDKCKVKKVSA